MVLRNDGTNSFQVAVVIMVKAGLFGAASRQTSSLPYPQALDLVVEVPTPQRERESAQQEKEASKNSKKTKAKEDAEKASRGRGNYTRSVSEMVAQDFPRIRPYFLKKIRK